MRVLFVTGAGSKYLKGNEQLCLRQNIFNIIGMYIVVVG